MATRKYEQKLRAEAAEETRARILEALHERLSEAPSRPVSIDEIAATAGVARSTVYAIFGSRAGLFDAFAIGLLQRGGFDRLVEAAADPDARSSLRNALRRAVEMFVPDRDVLRALFSMAQLDEEAFGGAIKRLERERAAGMVRAAKRLSEENVLRPDVTVGEAANLLWVLTSFDGFDLLYTGRGLPIDEVTDLLVATAERSLCVS